MVVRSSGFLGIPNPDRMQELIAVFDQYKDPGTNILDANNPDYLAAIDAINQKYADNMFMTPQQLQDANFPGMIQQASTGDTTSTTDDPLSMGSNQGALSNLDNGVGLSSLNTTLDNGVELSSLNTTFEEDVLPVEGPGSTFIPSGITKDTSADYGGRDYTTYIDDDGVTRYTSNNEALTEYDQYVDDQGIPIVDGFAVFDKNQHTMGGFDIGAGESSNSTPVYVDDDGVVRYSSGQELNLPSSVLQEIKDAAVDYGIPVQIYSSFAQDDPLLENSNKFGTLGGILAQSLAQMGVRKRRGLDSRDDVTELNPYRHQMASAIFRNEAGDVLQYNFVGKRAGEFSYDKRPSSLEGYKLISGTFRNNDKDIMYFDVPEEFQNYDYTNALTGSPTLIAEQYAEITKDDKSDNDIWYVDPDGNTRVDVTGTGYGIPVGSTHIGLFNAHSDSLNNVDAISEGKKFTPSEGANFQQFAFTKGTDGFYVTGSDQDPFKDNMVESGEYNQLGVDSEFLDEYKFGEGSQYGSATSSFMDTVTNEEGKFEFSNQPYDIGAALGFDAGKFVLSSFPSDKINLEPFMAARGTAGSDAQFLYSQMDKLPNYKQVLEYLTGQRSYDKIDFDTLGFFNEDGSIKIDTFFDTDGEGKNLVDYMNEYLSGTDSEGTDSAIFSDTFEQTTSTDNVPINGDGDGENGDGDGENGDGENGDGENGDGGTPDETEPFVVRAYQGSGVGPFARNYIFQRFGYTPTETIDMLLRYDPVEQLYFFEDGSPVDPEFLQNMQLTKLDDEGQVVRDEDGNPVRMPKVVINNEEEE